MQRACPHLLGRAAASAKQALRPSLPILLLPGVRVTSTTIANAHPTLHSTQYRRRHTTSSDPASTSTAAAAAGQSNQPRESIEMTAEDSVASHQQQQQPLPALPPLPEPGSGSDPATTHQLDLSGGQGTVSLDRLGPMVVNRDGTMSRIANWAEMSEIERQNTLRILGKRNQLRLDDLRAAKAKEEQQQAAENKS